MSTASSTEQMLRVLLAVVRLLASREDCTQRLYRKGAVMVQLYILVQRKECNCAPSPTVATYRASGWMHSF
eukprot:2372164-Rhodomonas_salina.1